MKNLETMGVQEMSAQEIKKVDGGGLDILPTFNFMQKFASRVVVFTIGFLGGINEGFGNMYVEPN